MVNWQSLISLANRAKDMGCNVIANIAVAVVVSNFTHATNAGVKLEWETGDVKGLLLREAYYDLLVVVLDGERLCIPEPLLCRGVTVACLKCATVVTRRDHSGDRRSPWAPRSDLDPLWVEIDQILDRATARRAVEDCLDGDTAVKVLGAIDQQWHTLAERRRAKLAATFPFLDEAVKEGIVSIREDGRVYVCLSRSGKDAWAEISPAGDVDADCLVGTSNLHLSELEHWISVLVGSEKAAEAVSQLRS